jgi:DNA-binding MarR family transcriptional regulator
MNATTIQPVEEDVLMLEELLLKMAWLEYKRFWRELSIHDLTPSQFHTLVAIKENGVGCTMSNLADETNQVSATMTGIVDRLVERGLVERRRYSKDRRRVLVYLTEYGKAKLEAVYRDKCLKLAGCLENLDRDSRHKLTFSLQQYLQILESTPL